MFVSGKYKILSLAICLVMALSACGISTGDQSAISTAVAQTMEARDTESAPQNPPAETPTLVPDIAFTSEVIPSETPTPAANPNCTVKAILTNETIPDGTIIKPGDIFYKTWTLQNTGTCTWDRSYKLVYWSGDLIGASPSYVFPEVVAPGESKNITILLKAPDANGTYTGYWKIQSPWGTSFGVGDYDNPFWVKIAVGSGAPANSKTKTVYGVTNVTVDVSRQCTAANTFYTITAHISTSGPVTVTFAWEQSDGNNDPNNRIKFTQADIRSVNREWSQKNSSTHVTRWVRIVVTSPVYQEFDKVVLPDLCQ